MLGLLKPTTREDGMPTDEIIIRLFLTLDERLGDIKKRPHHC
jgi:hypothetical protein